MAMKQFMEKKIAKSREKAEQVGYIEKMLKDQQIAAGHGQSERRVESLRWQREAEEEQEEYDQDFKLIQAAQQKAQKAQIAEMEDNIAKELEDRHAAAIRTEMNRRRVCAGSDELKALRRKLQAAEMNKLRKGQFKEKEVFAVEEKIYEKDIAGVMEAKRQIELAQEAVVAEGKHVQRIKTKDLQLKAIADRSIDREAEYQIFLKDKKQVADIVDRIAKEDQLVEEEKKRKVDETKLIVKKFQIENEQMKKDRKEREQEELRQIEEYARQKREHEERLLAEKQELERQKKLRLQSMLDAAEERDREAAELEYLRNELHQEELDALNRRREEMALRKKLEDRVEMHKAYEEQMHLKEQKREEQKSKEKEFRQKLLEKFAEDDRIEQMAVNKRRMRVEEHKREVNRLWQEKLKMLGDEAKRDKEVLEYQREQERMRQQIIRDERTRLLQEEAGALKDYLPKGVFEVDQEHVMIMGREPIKAEVFERS